VGAGEMRAINALTTSSSWSSSASWGASATGTVVAPAVVVVGKSILGRRTRVRLRTLIAGVVAAEKLTTWGVNTSGRGTTSCNKAIWPSGRFEFDESFIVFSSSCAARS